MVSWHWWQRGIVYQIYPRSFQDTSGNGVGDLEGIIQRLDYLNDGTPDSLGIDSIWISPFFPSPMADFGYDVADYTDVHTMFGDLATFDRLIKEAHARNIKIIIDYVPNHSSIEHPWFTESRSSRDNPKRDWYIWRDAKADGSRPNNWGSVFGGTAWTWDETTQQYYFHQFDPGQPDLNWRNPEVQEAMLEALRFWMRRGVDGFRMDVVYMIWKHPDMPDQPLNPDAVKRGEDDIYGPQIQKYSQNYTGIHDMMRRLRATLDEFGDKVAIGEIWLPLQERMAYYGQDADEFHMPFNFDLISQADFLNPRAWSAQNVQSVVDDYEAAVPDFGWPNYVLGNHDVPRLASRLGSEAKARVAGMLLLTLRGTPTLYMGDEIGMVNGLITEADIQDPQGLRLGLAHSRDVCRTPVQWDSSAYAGFSSSETWLPVHPDYTERNVATLSADPASILTLYKRMIWLRKSSEALSIGSYRPLEGVPDCFIFVREHGDEYKLVALNFSDSEQTIPLPHSGQIRLSTHLDREGDSFSDSIQLRPNEGLIADLL